MYHLYTNIFKDYVITPSVATMMITRNCLHRCSNCRIYRQSNDLNPNFWTIVGRKLHDTWGIHVNLYGGEPLCYDGLETIIKSYTDYRISYSINSSSSPLSSDRAKNLVKLGLLNWTVSIDSMRKEDVRSSDGISAIEYFKNNNVKDLMIETVAYPGGIDNNLDVINYAIKNKFWISLSTMAYGLSSNYDSFPDVAPIWSENDKDKLKSAAIILKKYSRNHSDKQYLNILTSNNILYQKGKRCSNYMISFHPDYDGSMRLCRDIKGNRVTKWNAIDAIDHYKEFHRDWIQDYNELCLGCNWSCLYFSPNREEEIKHV